MNTDPIADMLTRIRNALLVHAPEISMPHSNIKQAVAQILAENAYIVGSNVEGEGVEKRLVVTVTNENSASPITEIKRVSKPGRRVYAKVADIPVVKQGRGLVIVSTSKGLMTGDTARKSKLGGEVICEIY